MTLAIAASSMTPVVSDADGPAAIDDGPTPPQDDIVIVAATAKAPMASRMAAIVFGAFVRIFM
ncbi:hypothetical protein CCAX7_64920 [Capsulimonas corticalis]|uniref:Uncharacterized protein n=1 Tax=Capsulimonas corticalis TaxID=2219043 RepID=A0A402CQW7_9BACT|nr:hypothetical protein CCAX7_64920 [Capsulimonas corticalis]